MFACRSSASPFTVPGGRVLIALTTFITIGIGLGGIAAAADNIGIFWDTGYTQDTTTVESFPGILTGYLVLKDATTAAGLLGWELCVDVDGPAQFLDWTLEGQNINAASPPCFAVGIAPDPIPSDGDVLLATFQIMVNEALPVALSVRASYKSSVPYQMSFIPAEDPGALWPMFSVSGQPVVAWINDHIPDLEITPNPVFFQNTPFGTTDSQWVYVTNHGQTFAPLDVSLAGDCGSFSLPQISGRINVPVGNYLRIKVAYTPATTDFEWCNLELNVWHDAVRLTGSGSSQPSNLVLPSLPIATRLLPNVPNPFNPQTELRFELAEPQPTRVCIYDLTGRLVTVVVDDQLEAGSHKRLWQGRDSGGRQVPSGVYYVRLETPDRTDHHKIMLLK